MEFGKTSIVILTYNKLEYTQKCIDSIRKFTSSGSYEIVIVDNNSTDGTVEWLKAQGDIRTIFNNENMGFPKGCNQGIEISRGNSILLLNNDVIVTPNWLNNLNTCLFSSDNIGAVGPVTNCCHIQEIPVSYTTTDEMIEFSKSFNISDPKKWEERLKLIGFALLIKKEVIKKIGFLDERFSPGNFEDDDYSYRIKKAGYNLILCKDTFIHHFGSTSFKDMGKQFSGVFSSNFHKFMEKWGFHPYLPTSFNTELVGLIDKSSSDRFTVLDVGCACGATLLHIKNIYKEAVLHGIELNKYAADLAATIADVKVQDIEMQDQGFEEGYFDYIIFIDVLGHLKDPWGVLKNMKKYLKPDGKVLARIPNIMHFSIIRNLLKGNWTYEDTGILDRALLRYFTFNEINRMFTDTGYKDMHYMGKTLGKNKEDEEFIQAVSKFSGLDLVKQFEISHYFIKASVNPYEPANTKYVSYDRKKTFVTLFPETENFHLTKDVGMIAYILHKYFNYDSIMVCYKNGEYPYLNNEVKGLKIDFMERITGDSEEDGKKYLIKNAARIDILHLFHLCKRSLNLIVTYKSLNPKGKVYLKLDASVYDKKITLSEPIINILKLCDLISIETKHLYDYFNENWPITVEYIPNGFYDHVKREEVEFEEKENIICTVGRIGTRQKDNETLMEAFKLASPSLPGWKLKLIGPVREEFKTYITDFFDKNPHLKDKVIFTGEISDKKVLNEEYKKAKIFCMTSLPMESFGLVFVEAARNGCFIISSDIPSAWDVTDNKKFGEIFEVGNIVQLSELLVHSCGDEERLRNTCKPIQSFMYENFYWVDICRKIDEFLKG